MDMSRTAFAAALLLPLLAAPALAADTARASGRVAIHTGPGDVYPIIDKLRNDERVLLESCTRFSRWCHVVQLDGGPSGWAPGSYLVGSGAKNAVTPFEFSFDPMDPLGLFRRR
jgi:uncharacterized protein YraI